MKDLASKCAVITGAASGLGFALARAAVEHDMNVVISDINAAALQEAVTNLSTKEHQVVSVVSDVADPQDIEAICEAAKQHFGGTDLLINNAGRMLNKFVWEHSAEDWNNILGVNIGGVTNALTTFLPAMLERGAPAHVVNVGSIASFLPSPLMASYTASKFSALAITESLKYELDLIGSDIGVSLVAPGPVDTSIFTPTSASSAIRTAPGEQLRQAMAEAIQSMGMKADQAAGIVFDGIKQNKFWIFTHPELLENLTERAQSILNGEPPVYETPSLSE